VPIVFDPAAVCLNRIDGEVAYSQACEASIEVDELANVLRVLVVHDDGRDVEYRLDLAKLDQAAAVRAALADIAPDEAAA